MTSLFSHPLPPPPILRPFQTRAVAEVARELFNRPLLVGPTGSGKTVTGCEIVRQFAGPSLWLAHREELITQAESALRRVGLHVGIIKAGHEPDPSAPIQIASVQTLNRRSKPPADLIIVDEAHRSIADSYTSIFSAYPGVPIVGLTATPFRLDGRGLGAVYGAIVVSAYVDELVEQGYLVAPRVYATTLPDLRGVHVDRSDYILSELSARMQPHTPAIVDAWKKHAAGQRTVCFAVDVAHSKHIARAFNTVGIRADHLDGQTPADERRSILDKLAAGQIQVLCNCQVLGEGWDLPTLECAIIARPTASLNFHLQTVGRVMRTATGKTGAIVLDHSGNHHRHGLVTRRLNYSLDGSVKTGESEPLGLRHCKSCFALYDVGLPGCPQCGAVPPPPKPRAKTASTDYELAEYAEDFEYRATIWQMIEAEREASDFAEGWASYRYKERFGGWPVLAGRELIDPAGATREQKEQIYAQFVALGESKGHHPGAASHRYRDIFGVWPSGFVGKVRGDREAIRQKFMRRLPPKLVIS